MLLNVYSFSIKIILLEAWFYLVRKQSLLGPLFRNSWSLSRSDYIISYLHFFKYLVVYYKPYVLHTSEGLHMFIKFFYSRSKFIAFLEFIASLCLNTASNFIRGLSFKAYNSLVAFGV